MELSELKETLEQCGALEQNVAKSDSELSVEIDRLLEDPIITNSIVVDNLHLLPRNVRPEAILSDEYDQLYAFASATAAWARFYYADKENDFYVLNHGFALRKKTKVLIAVSVLEDAEKIKALISLAESYECEVIGVMCLQSKISLDLINAPLYALLHD